MIDDLLREIGEIDQAIEAHDSKIKTLTLEKKNMQLERERLAKKAANEMIESGCTASDVDGVRWSIRNVPAKVVVTDEAQIPPKFFNEKVTRTLSKTLIKNALNSGIPVQGAHLSNGDVTLVAKGIT